jgi:type I restriction-modification system DNA methylase subunit
MLFDEDLKTDVNLYRQNIQTEFVKKATFILSDPRYDNASKAAAYNTLKELKDKLKKASSSNEQTKAHRANLVYLIDKALVIK